MVQQVANTPEFQMADLRSADVKLSSMTLPESVYSEAGIEGVVHSFALDEWNTGGRYILMQHTFKDQTEWLMVDTENVSQSINITRTLGVNFKDIHFSGTSGRTLFGLADDGAVRKLDLSSGTLSRVLVSNVESFQLYETDIISYVGTDPTDATKKVAGVYRDGDEVSHVLRRVNNDAVLAIAVGRYFTDDYVAIAENNKVTILKGSYPTSSDDDTDSLKQLATMQLINPVQRLSFSPKSDYILAESSAGFMTYEIEHLRTAAGTIDKSSEPATTPLQWLDIAHVWNQQNGQLVMRDFDNSNVFTISAVAGNYDATLSQNGRFIYSIGKSDKGFTLQRVKMILE